MKPTAIGRILLWRGGSLWIGRAGEPADFHTHHAIQISLPFPGGRVRLRGPRESWSSYGAGLVAAQRVDAFEAREELVATVFSEPESRDGRVLQRRHRDEGISSLGEGTLQNEIAALAAAYARHADDVELVALARAAITTLSGATTTAEITLDRRIERAVALVREQLDQAVQLGEIAAAVHLPLSDFDISSWNRPACDFRAYVLPRFNWWSQQACACSTQCRCGSTCSCVKA